MAEQEGAFVHVTVQTTDVADVGQSCILTTQAITAMAGKFRVVDFFHRQITSSLKLH